jgi:uncharacterized protein (TIGR02117 family)
MMFETVFFLLKKAAWLLFFVVLIIILYAATMLVIAYIPANENFSEAEEGIDIYVMTNGVHTDLIFPYQTPVKDWHEVFGEAVEEKKLQPKYAAFGWGDKGFYLETPTWAELKFSTAFKALFFLSSTAVHVSFYRRIEEGEDCAKIKISPETYLKLTEYVEKSMVFDAGKPKRIPEASYGKYDVFYDAHGTYSLFYTCNSWTNEGLKQAGITASKWALLDKPVMSHVKNIGSKK